MSNTAHINMINIRVSAVEQITRDRANGTYDANVATDSDYYMWWNSDFAMIPDGMRGDPEGFVADIVSGLPTINAIHVPFNENNFNADGSMNPQFERFLAAAASHGLKIVMVYCSGVAQRLDGEGADTAEEIYDILNVQVRERVKTAFDGMLDWLDAHPAVKSATWGLEIMNEPHAYALGGDLGDNQAFLRLYGDQVLETIEQINARFDGKILVDGAGWSVNFNGLAKTEVIPGSGVSIMDAIRSAAGTDLVWSAHLYPDWIDLPPESTDDFRIILDGYYGAIGDDDIIITETNGQNSSINNHSLAFNPPMALSRMFEVLAERGIGIGWFPAMGGGESSLIGLSVGSTPTYGHLNSLSHALNAFSLGDAPVGREADEVLNADIIAGRVFDGTGIRMPVTGVAFAFGYDGDDTIYGNAATLNMTYGGDGNDMLIGSGYNDHLFGQGNDDTLLGNAGDDHLFGGFGNDVIDGGEGNDIMGGGDGADIFIVGAGNDIIEDYDGMAGDRLMVNGELRTLREIMESAVRFDGNGDGVKDELRITTTNGNVLFFGLSGDDLFAEAERDRTVYGRSGADVMLVGFRELHDGDRITHRADVINGLAGNDFIDAGHGNDLVYGGEGNDTIRGEDDDDTLRGDTGHDQISGDEGNDQLHGGMENDLLLGGNGDDVLSGDEGDDRLNGDAGDDTVRGGVGNDAVSGGSGRDILYGDSGNDKLDGHEGVDTLYGGDGNDTLTGGSENDRLKGDSGADRLNGGYGDDTLEGGSGIDTLRGDDGDDFIDGGGDGDMLDGASGADKLRGRDGNDTLYGGSGNDDLVGGAGDDTLNGDGDDDILHANEGNDVLNGGGGNDLMWGGTGNDTFSGGTGNDTMRGRTGDDRMRGDEGNDLIEGDEGNDTLEGGLGNDRLFGGTGNDRLLGGDGFDTLIGQDGFDTLDGGNDNDLLDSGIFSAALFGGAGDDQLIIRFAGVAHAASGGSGADTFILTYTGGAASTTIITDFSAFEDRILLDGGISLRDAISAGTIRHYENTPGGITIHLGGTDKLKISGMTLEGFGAIAGGADHIATGMIRLGINQGAPRGGGAVTGTAYSDNLFGVLANDTLMGLGGDDDLNGYAGNDLIDAGPGDDNVRGGAGDDTIIGGEGKNWLLGNDGHDRISTGSVGSKLDGGAGRDVLTVSGGVNAQHTLIGGLDDDSFHFASRSAGTSTIVDIIDFDQGDSLWIDERSFADAMFSDGTISSVTQSGNDILVALSLDDKIILRGTTLTEFDAWF